MKLVARPPLRVDVAPVGYYVDRVVEPIIAHDADRVYFIRERDSSKDKAFRFRQSAADELRRWKPRLDLRVIPTDMWNLESAVETFSGIVRREVHEGNSVWVNLSTGSKLEAVAAALACMAHGGSPYYVQMASYETPEPTSPLAHGVKETTIVPVYGLDVPTTSELEVLALLAENPSGLSKQELLFGLGEANVIPSNVGATGSTLSPQAQYGRLQAILEGLTRAPPLAEISGSRKAGRVRITARGIMAIRIFLPREPEADEATQVELPQGRRKRIR